MTTSLFQTALGAPPGPRPTPVDLVIECRTEKYVRCDDVARTFVGATATPPSRFEVVSGVPAPRLAFARCAALYDNRGLRIGGEGE